MNPHNLPPPPSGPPMMGGPPQLMSHRGGVGGGMGGRSPFTNTILITNMPPFFLGYQQVRDWLYPCGTAKTCLFYPRVPKRKKNNNSNSNDDDGDNNKTVGDIEMMIANNEGGEVKEGNESNTNNNKKTVLINMINPDQALKVVASFKAFAGQLDDRYNDIRCYMVPSSPDIPLPPPLVDETTKKVLGEKLWHNFVSLETSYSDSDHKNNSGVDGSSGNTTGAKTSTPPTTTTNGDTAEESDKTNDAKDTGNNTTASPSDGNTNEPKLLDANKVAAAAGGVGTYDADEDPLNAPQVLEAVKEFRRKLDRTHGSQKTQRMDLVAKKLKELRPRIRAQVITEKTNRRQTSNNAQRLPPGALPPLPAPPQNTSLPQPPLPQGGAPPPSLGLPPPPRAAAAADSGKRGRSNLPAWMTKQQQQQTASTSDAPASKKARTTTEQYPSHFPAALPPASHPVIRQFLANQVKESMGEEEATLIDFLYTHILQGKATSELLQELQVVLEEEADGFLKAVWTKVQEIQQQQQ